MIQKHSISTENTRKLPKRSRKLSIFAANPSVEAVNTKKRQLGRATTDNSIRKELRRQELAEDRRKKFDDYLTEKSNRRTSLAPSMSSLPSQSGSTMGKSKIFVQMQPTMLPSIL